MNELIKSLEQEQLKNEVPNFGPGDTVKVHVRIVEGKRERIQVFEGVVIKRQGGGNRETSVSYTHLTLPTKLEV